MKPQSIYSHLLSIVLILISSFNIHAQNTLPKIGVINIDSKGYETGGPITQLVRIELSKLKLFEVLDRYDIEDLLRKNNINLSTCMDRECLLKTGKLLNADFMLSGNIEKLPNKVVIMFRQMEVSSGNTIKSITKEYPDNSISSEILIEVTLKKMYDIEITDPNKQNLENRNPIPTAVNSENATVSIGGPRFGFGFLTGNAAEFFQRSKKDGGYDGYPAMFQFGYQFEKMYLSEGNLQAIFEFLPMVSGVDQGHFIPSFTLLNGFRHATNGWEIAFGPTLTWTKMLDMYKDSTGTWQKATMYIPANADVVSRLHTDGDAMAKPGLLIGFGKTFKTGKLSMPLNAYIIPRKNSFQFGVSYGFNTLRKQN